MSQKYEEVKSKLYSAVDEAITIREETFSKRVDEFINSQMADINKRILFLEERITKLEKDSIKTKMV